MPFGKSTLMAMSALTLSGTLLVPSSNLLAAPAPDPAVIESPIETAAPAPASVAPSPVPAPPMVAPVAAARPQRERAQLSQSELDCLTRVVLYEAGAEPRAGQVAVAQVVMNRMRSGRFPRTVCGVIYQRGQFSSIRSFAPPRGARWQRAERLARDVIDGTSPIVGNALYFHATHVRPAYVRSRTRVAQVGNHIFYR